MRKWLSHTLRISFMVFAICLLFSNAQAEDVTVPIDPSKDICTNTDSFNPDQSGTPGIVSTIASQVQSELDTLESHMFSTISGDAGFKMAVRGAITLYVAIYGILLAFGMARETVYEIMLRMVKLSIVALLLNAGNAWSFFYDNVVHLFNASVDDLINHITSVAVGAATPQTQGVPLGVLDNAINKAFSSKMVVHLFAMATTGAYGLFHVVLSGIALYSLVGSFLLAIWIYLMSLVMRTLLFGLAPIFIACLLFERTKPIFIGWLNQIISVCLQPIFLFTFLSFFIILMEGTIDKMLETPVCWTERTDTGRGMPFTFILPTFAIPDPQGGSGWVQFKGDYGPNGIKSELDELRNYSGDVFPVDLLAILTFYLLTQLGRRFSEVSVTIGKDLASGAVGLLSMQAGLQDFFTPGDKIAAPSKIGERTGPPKSPDEISAAQRASRDIIDGARRLRDMVTNRKKP